MDSIKIKKLLIESLIAGIIWGLTYLFIRRKINPETSHNYMKYKLDAFYGSVAVFIAMILKYIAFENIFYLL
jgi:hypothetical protein